MANELPYSYCVSYSLRPAERRHRVDTKVLRLDEAGDFHWRELAILSTFEFSMRIRVNGGWWMNSPVLASNLGREGPVPFTLAHREVLSRGSEIVFEIHNDLEKTRKWNRIQMILSGSKVGQHPIQ
jgi:hypothetical protein